MSKVKKTNKGKNEKPQQIMVGDVNIEPMTAEQLIPFNKQLIKKIYKARRVQSEARRELGWMKSCIDNLREKCKEQKTLKMLALEDYSQTLPEVSDELKYIKQQMKYAEYTLEERCKNADELIGQDNMELVDSHDKEYEAKLWHEIIVYKDKVREIYTERAKKMGTKNDIYGIEKRKRQKFWEENKQKYFEMKKNYNARMLDPILNLDTFYLNNFHQLAMDADKDWRGYRLAVQDKVNESITIDTKYLTRMIKYEDRLIKQYDHYLAKIEDSKKKVEHYEQILEKRQKEAATVEKEMAELRRKTNNIMNTTKYIQNLRRKVDVIEKDCRTLNKASDQFLEKYNYLLRLGAQYCGTIEAVKSYEFREDEEDLDARIMQEELLISLEKLTGRVVERMDEILSGMPAKLKAQVLQSLGHFEKVLGALQFEYVRNVKDHNELVNYMDRFLELMHFNNPIPFKKIEGTDYRSVPTQMFANICWPPYKTIEDEE